MIENVAIEFAQSLGIIKALTDLAQSATAIGRRRQISTVLKELRKVYFFEDQTLALLDRLISEEAVSATDLYRAAQGFGGGRDEALKAISELEEFAHKNSTHVSINTLSKLRSIVYGKRGVRVAIADFFRDADEKVSEGTLDRKRLAGQARLIRDMVVELNSQISEVDEALLKLAT
jgi:hypothetical protein